MANKWCLARMMNKKNEERPIEIQEGHGTVSHIPKKKYAFTSKHPAGQLSLSLSLLLPTLRTQTHNITNSFKHPLQRQATQNISMTLHRLSALPVVDLLLPPGVALVLSVFAKRPGSRSNVPGPSGVELVIHQVETPILRYCTGIQLLMISQYLKYLFDA